MERPFFPTEIGARSQLARVGLISKHHYHPEILQFDVLDYKVSRVLLEMDNTSLSICKKNFAI